MWSIGTALQQVKRRVASACESTGRPVQSVTLLAVSKTQSAEAVRAALAAGQPAFGENYVQEALDKMAALADARAQIEWHLIGPLQSNKTRVVAEHFDWVHAVDRLKIAQRLSEQRPPELPPLNIFLQVNVDGETSKAGVAPEALPELARAVLALPRLRLRGLMSIPQPVVGFDAQRLPHQRLRACFEALRLHLPAPQAAAFDQLSMGMSADLEAAVAEGTTILRVGTAIFGARVS